MADGIRVAAATLAGEGVLYGAAFGRLPEGLAAESEYQSKLNAAIDSLSRLQAAIEEIGTNLTATAATYGAAELDSTVG
ncbi:MAG: hypothetical protein M3024_03855 [Candidatus Dormibacteraeota bacterium]|nr:hypothetical protein [Candidatus Dormibacteraeota bacterium]